MSADEAAEFLDISVLLGPGTPPWPGDTPFSCGWTWSIKAGASVNVSAVTSSPHVGTHADAPLHVRDGAAASDKLKLDAFIGPAIVIDATRASDENISPALLSSLLPPGPIDRLLLRTGRSIAGGNFPAAWPHLSEDSARFLLERGLKLFGVDCPSVDVMESKSLPIHHLLFDGGAVILENLDLGNVEPGAYELIALPLRLEGLDAAPVRAILRVIRHIG